MGSNNDGTPNYTKHQEEIVNEGRKHRRSVSMSSTEESAELEGSLSETCEAGKARKEKVVGDERD